MRTSILLLLVSIAGSALALPYYGSEVPYYGSELRPSFANRLPYLRAEVPSSGGVPLYYGAPQYYDGFFDSVWGGIKDLGQGWVDLFSAPFKTDLKYGTIKIPGL